MEALLVADIWKSTFRYRIDDKYEFNSTGYARLG